MADSYKTISAPYKYSGTLNNFERDVMKKSDMSNKRSFGSYPDLFTIICSDLIPDPSDPSKTIPGPDHGKVFVIDKTRDLDPVYGYCVPVGSGDLPENVTETFEEMPDPEEREENEIVQYVGPTTDVFDNGNFYKDTRVEGEIPQLYPLSGDYIYNFGGEDKRLHVISTSAKPEVGDTIYSLTFDVDNTAQLTEVGTIKTTAPAVTLEGLGGDPDTEAEAISNLINSFDATTPEKTPVVSEEPRPYDAGDMFIMTGEECVAAGSSDYVKVDGIVNAKDVLNPPTPIEYEWPAGSGEKKTINLVAKRAIFKYGAPVDYFCYNGQKLVTITYDADNVPIFTEMAEIISGEYEAPSGLRVYVGVKYTGPVAEAGTELEAIKNSIDAITGDGTWLTIDCTKIYLDWPDPKKAPSYISPSDEWPLYEIGDGSPIDVTYDSEEYSVTILAGFSCHPEFGLLDFSFDKGRLRLVPSVVAVNKATGLKSRYNIGPDVKVPDFAALFTSLETPSDFETEPTKVYLDLSASSIPFKEELLAAWNAKFPESGSDNLHYADVSFTKYTAAPAESPFKFPDYHVWTHVEQGKPATVTQNTFPINMDNFTGVTEFNEFSFIDFMTKATYKYNDTITYVAWDEHDSPLKDDAIVLGSRESIPGKTVDEYFVATGYGDPITIGFRATNNTSVASSKIVKVMGSENGSAPTEVPIVTEPNDRIYAVMSVLPPEASDTNTVNFVIYLEDGKTMTYDVKLTNKISNAFWYGYISTETIDNLAYETVENALTNTEKKTLTSKVVVINDSPRVDTPIDNVIDVKVSCSGSENGHIAFFIPSLPADHLKDLINIPAIIDKNRLDNTDSFATYNVKDASGNFRGYLAISKETPTCSNFKYSLTVNKFVVV